jgi:hypothetical protein
MHKTEMLSSLLTMPKSQAGNGSSTVVAALACLLAMPQTGAAFGQGRSAVISWTVEKCVRYKASWTEYLKRRGGDGLSSGFLNAHRAFVESGCMNGRDVCPRSTEELAAANAMTIRAMNAGTASTFLPFACPR